MRNEQMLLFSSQSESLGPGGRLRQAPAIPRPMPVSVLAEEEEEEEEEEDGVGEMGRIVLGPTYADYENGWIQEGKNVDDCDLLLYPNPFDEEPCIPHPTHHLTCLVRKEETEAEEDEEEGGEAATEDGKLTRGEARGPLRPPARQDHHLHGRHLSGLNLCAGCGAPIVDRYYLVTLNRRWHTTCLSCHHCRQSLDLHLTCFVKDERIYCKEDYCRLFAPKRCSRCQLMISGQELVIRVAADDIYHADCFVCSVCERRLRTGESFAVRDRRLFCQLHYGLMVSSSSGSGNPDDATTTMMMMMMIDRGRGRRGGDGSPSFSPPSSSSSSLPVPGPVLGGANDALQQQQQQQQQRGPGPFKGPAAGIQKGRPRKRKAALTVTDPVNVFGEMGYDLGDVEMLGYRRQGPPCSFKDGGCLQGASSSSCSGSNRQKRMRTSFKHHQLRTMKAYFALNHNPDAKDLKELAQKTGLTKRVLQVWFQNARAKYRRNVLKQENENSSSAANDVTASALNGSSSASSSSVIDNADDAKMMMTTTTKTTKLSSSGRRVVVVVNGASPGFDLSDCGSSSQSPKTVDASTGLEMDHSTSSSTLLEMFDQTYVHSN